MLAKAKAYDAKHAKGNPVAARQLAKLEAEAVRTGKSPKQVKASKFKQAKTTQQAKLLTILVEFNEQANDDFTGSMVPNGYGAEDCVAGNVQNGPTHNQIPNPATAPLKDNNSMWVPDFSSEHYNKMLYTKTGITERVRPDLTGPDGKAGIDISGYTMKNMYEEMSKGAYTVSGAATPWITVPHSEAYYGATVCHKDEKGVWTYGADPGHAGPPEQPARRRPAAHRRGRRARQGAAELPLGRLRHRGPGRPSTATATCSSPTASSTTSCWCTPVRTSPVAAAPRARTPSGRTPPTVAGGAPVPGTNLRLSNYIVQPEDSGVGVFAHEYGHDLGLPDLYDTASGGDSDVDFWDLMSSGSHSGPIFQSMPTHMGIWDKWVLGWADPVQLNPGDDPRSGQGRPDQPHPQGHRRRRQDQPAAQDRHPRRAAQRHQHVVLQRRPVVGQEHPDPRRRGPGRCHRRPLLDVEQLPHRGGLGLRLRRGLDRRRHHVDRAEGLRRGRQGGHDPRRLRRPERAHGRLRQQEVRPHRDHRRLGALLRQPHRRSPARTSRSGCLYATDAAFEDKGWFVDDLSVTNGATTVWSDDAEANNGWTATVGTFTDSTRRRLGPRPGHARTNAQYYLVEWRNFDGFDKGLQYAYDTTYQKLGGDGAWKVEKIKYNAPGALVWYRDTSYGNANHVLNNLTTLPSEGAKGGLLIVDSHFDPLRRSGANAAQRHLDAEEPAVASAVVERRVQPVRHLPVQRVHDARPDFTGEACNTFGRQAAVKSFTDNKGWYPGFEIRAQQLFYRDADASTVVPSVGNAALQRPGHRRCAATRCRSTTGWTSVPSPRSARATRPTTVSATAPRSRSPRRPRATCRPSSRSRRLRRSRSERRQHAPGPHPHPGVWARCVVVTTPGEAKSRYGHPAERGPSAGKVRHGIHGNS